MEQQELDKLKRLILQAPANNHLLLGEFDAGGFEKYSQLPEMPDREQWWRQMRVIAGFLIMCMRDVLIQQSEIKVHVEEVIAALEELFKEDPVKPEPVVEKIEAEVVQPPNFVPGSTWDPFKED